MMVELKVNMRQQNDTSFSLMFNHIRKGEHTHEDVKTIPGASGIKWRHKFVSCSI